MKRQLAGCLLAASVLLTGCTTTTQINAVWKDPAYQAHPSKIMVVGVAKNPLNRRILEDEFVLQLKGQGANAIASYTVLPDKQQDNQEAISAKVKELKADTILITRMASKKTVQVYVPETPYFPPPYYGLWPNYYGYGYQYLYTPGYVSEDEYAVIETNLYDAGNDKLIWAATSDAGLADASQERMRAYVGVFISNMIGLGLLGK